MICYKYDQRRFEKIFAIISFSFVFLMSSSLFSAAAEDHFGFSQVACDFNGDGYDDLAIGVPYESIDGHENAGAVSPIVERRAGRPPPPRAGRFVPR